MERILENLRRRNEKLRGLTRPPSREDIASLYQQATKAVGVELEFNRGDFCRAYFDEVIAETEVLPRFLGLATEPDDFYTILEQLPESLTFTNLRLRARSLAYVEKISQEHLTKLINQLIDFIINKNAEDDPYEEIVIRSFSMANDQALEVIVDRVASLIHDNRGFEPWWAASALGKIGGEQAANILLKTLNGAEGGERMQAAFALGKMREKRALDHLRNALKDEKTTIRWSAADALGHIGDERAVGDLLERIKDSEAIVHQAAAEALGKIGGDQTVTGLHEALSDKKVEVRLAAAFALGLLGDSDAEETVLEILRDRENESDARLRAASALGEIGSERSVKALFEALNDDKVRREAASALGEIGKRGVGDAIDTLLEALKIENDDPSKANDIRWRAAWELGKIYETAQAVADACSSAAWELGKFRDRAVPGLIRALKDRRYSGSRWRAAQALGKIGGQEAENALLETLKDEDNFVRTSAALALGWLGHHEVIDTCLAALNDRGDDKSLVRWRAAEALGKIGGRRAVPSLLEALEDEIDVREPAAKALARISNEELAAGLIDALSESHSFVREKAAQVVGYYAADGQALQVLNELSRLATSDPFDEVRSAAYEAREKFLRKLYYLGIETETVARAEEIGHIKMLEETRAFIAHEVKNAIGPLRVIAQLLDETLTQPDFDKAKLAEYTQQILKQTEAAYEFVNRYVDYAKPLTLQLKPTDINQLITQCLNEVSAECEQNKIDVDFQLEETPRTYVDAVLIEEVFRNGLRNAIEAMECCGKLTIAARQEADKVIITISDTGSGIKPEHLGHVFELGFTTKLGRRGAGLGLALVRRIVEKAHSGRVSIKNNTSGKGATLAIELPIADKEPYER